MGDEKGYNGWTNYETWVVNLWLGNDQSSDSFWRGAAQAIWDHAAPSTVWTREEAATFALADLLKQHHERESPVAAKSTVYADLMNAALSEVDWREIAEDFIEDVTK